MASKLARWAVAVAAALLTLLYVLPLWTIRLQAPQYPEGLGMRIHIGVITGLKPNDLQNINELNHYIGMRPIDPSGMHELQWIPVIVAILVVSGLLAAALGRRTLLLGWCAVFFVGAASGLADFYRWEYDYGHHLDLENAIIKIPGMSYQPPIIGVKHLLNFTAISYPASGGVVALVAGVLAAAAVLLLRRPSHDVRVPPGRATPLTDRPAPTGAHLPATVVALRTAPPMAHGESR